MMPKELYAVYGASGFGREIVPVARKILLNRSISKECLVFVDDDPVADNLNGHKVLSYTEYLNEDVSERYICHAIANSVIREKLTTLCNDDGVKNWSVCADNVVVMDEVEIGEGAILCPFVTLTSNIKIGKSFHANIYSYVAHDCVIGDYVTFAPGVKCNGNVVIEDHAYLGTGAIIKQGRNNRPLVIGKGAIVGAGAVVIKNVPAGVTVVGNPAMVLSKDYLRKKK